MSTAELIKQVKSLPRRERHKVFMAVLALEEQAPTPRSKTAARLVRWPDVEARTRRIFGKRVLPNLVQLERDESAF